MSDDWYEWPALPELFPTSFPGVKTSRDPFLVDVNLDRLKARVTAYFDTDLSHEEIARRYPAVMNATARFDARSVRRSLLSQGGDEPEAGFVRYAYRPFDTRWLYWEAETKLLDEKRADYKPSCVQGQPCGCHPLGGTFGRLRNRATSLFHRSLETLTSTWSVVPNMFPATGSATKPLEPTKEHRSVVPTCREPRSTISNASARTSRTCSITSLRCCTIRRTGRRTRGRSGWSGLASRFRAGRTATRSERLKSWRHRRRVAGSLPRCSTRIRQCLESRRERCVLRSR